MKNSSSNKTRVGVFVIIGTILLIVALYFIGNKQHIFSKTVHIYAVFQNVNGLQLGNNVRYSGINVGTVSTIEMISETKIVIKMMVEKKTAKFIKKDAIATIGSDGLVGSMVVNILPTNKNSPIVVSGDTIATYSKIRAEDILSTLNVTNENAALLTSDLLKITGKILKGEGALGALITDSLLTKDIKVTLANLKQSAAGVNTFVSTLQQKINTIDMQNSAAGVVLTDTIVGDQISSIVTHLEQSTKSIETTTKELELYLIDIKDSKSTLHYLMQDEALPLKIDSTIIEIKEASQKLNENMEALRSNFFFKSYFKKKARNKNKNISN